MKLIVELWSNVAKNEKPFSRNHKMLATDFHIIDRKISVILKTKITMQIFWCATSHTLFLILWRYVVFFNDITNQTILQNIEKIH